MSFAFQSRETMKKTNLVKFESNDVPWFSEYGARCNQVCTDTV